MTNASVLRMIRLNMEFIQTPDFSPFVVAYEWKDVYEEVTAQ